MAFFLPFGCIPLCVFYNNHAGIYFLVVVLGSGDGNERKVRNRRFLAEDESTLLSNRTAEGLDSSAVHSLSNSHLSRHKGYQNEENPVLALKEPSVYRLISSQPQNPFAQEGSVLKIHYKKNFTSSRSTNWDLGRKNAVN